MKKRFTKAIGFLVLTILPFWGFAQQHIPGDILIQLAPTAEIQDLLDDLERFEGKPTQIQNNGLISPPMRIWHLSFDASTIQEDRFLDYVWQQPEVAVAQFNHLMEERETIPDDPLLGTQWQWVNDGGPSSVEDADVDADLAWDITTGGFTANGDEIVVCVVEGGGSDYDHPDLIDNHWTNLEEIPNNDIDDDLNGYVDDFQGWNPPQGTDFVPGGNHGTAVSGMIGAKGNNGLGGTGINWDVKIMQVTVGNLSESNVIASYTYPLVMRQIYNESEGDKGAFVVSINSSWGIDGGNPANAPLWCAFYDTLGVHGIISCGATANQNYDIDVVGDLPTACPSDYMLSVTATNNDDERTFSAYGIEHVDLAAPGGGIYTASNGDGYDFTSGTSFATPLTAGVVALLYSAPCEDLANMAATDPAGAAALVRQYILDGVDYVDGLDGFVATSGRINAYKSLLLALADCGVNDCIVPIDLEITDIEGSTATLEWFYPYDNQGFTIQYRPEGSLDWEEITATGSSVVLENLTQCIPYEMQIQTQCDTSGSSAFSELIAFTADCVCESPMALDTSNVTLNEVTVTWEDALNADGYILRYRPLSSAVWTEIPVDGVNTYTFEELEECTNYRFEIRTKCATAESPFGGQIDAKTACELTSSTQDFSSTSNMWIYPVPVKNSVQIEWETPVTGTALLQLKDMTGRVLYTEKVNLIGGEQSIQLIDPVNDLASGLYIIELGGQKFRWVQKFMKE